MGNKNTNKLFLQFLYFIADIKSDDDGDLYEIPIEILIANFPTEAEGLSVYTSIGYDKNKGEDELYEFLDDKRVTYFPKGMDIYGDVLMPSYITTIGKNITIDGSLDLTWCNVEELPLGLTVKENLIIPLGITKLPNDLVVDGTIIVAPNDIDYLTEKYPQFEFDTN